MQIKVYIRNVRILNDGLIFAGSLRDWDSLMPPERDFRRNCEWKERALQALSLTADLIAVNESGNEASAHLAYQLVPKVPCCKQCGRPLERG